MRLLAFAFLVALAGCGSAPVWLHDTRDSSEYKKEFADCERFFGITERETEACMIRKGWYRQRR